MSALAGTLIEGYVAQGHAAISQEIALAGLMSRVVIGREQPVMHANDLMEEEAQGRETAQ